MFGIGLPEMILILALALIVVGPDKLPDLARSMAKGVMELKKTAEALKKNLTEDGTLDAIKSDLNNVAQGHPGKLLESSDQSWKTLTPGEGVNPVPDKSADKIIEAELTEINDAASAPPQPKTAGEVSTMEEDSVSKQESDTPSAC